MRASAEAVPAVEPAVGASLVASLRSLLIDRGLWGGVRERMLARDPDVASWIDVPAVGRWMPFAKHRVLMGAVRDVAGDDGIRELGRARIQHTLRGGVLAPLLRSWVRSYAGAPAQLLRVTPHAWRAATQGLGRIVVARTAEREMDVRVIGAPDVLAHADAWHRFLEGYGLGVLDTGALEGECVIAVRDGSLCGSFRWR